VACFYGPWGVKTHKQVPDCLHAGGVPFHVFPVFPSLLKDDGNHGPHEEGIGPRTDGQMDIGDFGGFGPAGIDDDELSVRIPGNLLKLSGRLGNLVALHAVPAEDQEEVRLLRIDFRMDILAAVYPAVDPEEARKLLGQGAVMVA